MIQSHPILFAVPLGLDTEDNHWARLSSIDVTTVVRFVECAQNSFFNHDGRNEYLDKLLQAEHNTNFKIRSGTLPVWRLIVMHDPSLPQEFTACLIAHHSMSDGAGLQIFHNTFQSALDKVAVMCTDQRIEHIVRSGAEDAIAPSLEQLHPLPIPTDSPETDASAIQNWTGSPVSMPCRTRYASLSLPAELADFLAQESKKHKSTATAAIPALIAHLLFNKLPATASSLLLNVPVSLRTDLPPDKVEHVMGNFIDAFRVELLRSNLDSQPYAEAKTKSPAIWAHAAKIVKGTRKYFANVSPTGEPYTNIAFFKLVPDIGAAFKSLIGRPRVESCEVSNMGKFSQPKGVQN